MPVENKLFYNVTYTYYDQSNPDKSKWCAIYLGSAGGPWIKPKNEEENKEKLLQLAAEWREFALGAASLIPCFDMNKLNFCIVQENTESDVSIEIRVLFEPNKK